MAGFDFDRGLDAPFEWAPVEGVGRHALPEALRARVFVHTVHDGAAIPTAFRDRVDAEALERSFVRERDWGANLVASHLARELGVGGYGRVTLARTLLDFNRFPGTTPPGGATHPFERLAINPPFADALHHQEKMELLDRYDEISAAYERHIHDKLITIGVHTYDERNPSQTSRPHLSLVTLPAGYQREARMPYGVFDPLYPDRLAESTCNRILRDRLSLELERGGFRVSGNHPYALPEGSVEVREQVWFFFDAVRREYEAAHPSAVNDDAHALVWTMLLNTNLRLGQAEALRGHLQRYRRPEPGQEGLFARAAQAYEAIGGFIDSAEIVTKFRRGPQRPSSLAFEVRKDLVCEMNRDGHPPASPSPSMRARAQKIGEIMAAAVGTYFETDRHRTEKRLD